MRAASQFGTERAPIGPHSPTIPIIGAGATRRQPAMTTGPNVLRRFRRFALHQDGAVTVDWVVMTAAVCGLAILVTNIITESIFSDAGDAMSANIEEAGTMNR
jgi:hypothetical protein